MKDTINQIKESSKAARESAFEAEVERIAALPIEEVRASLRQAGIEPTKILPAYLLELIQKSPAWGADNLSDYIASSVPPKAMLMLLRLLRAAQPISRAELARRVGVNRSTVTDAFKRLIAAGVVREEPLPQSALGTSRMLGRPALALSFDDEFGYFVGVNVGVRRSTVGLATLTGQVFAEEEFETPPDASDALAKIRTTVTRLCAQARGRRLRAIGVSVPGSADAARERIVYAPHLGWQDVDVANALRFDAEGRPSFAGERVRVFVENDATGAALYELRLRLGRDKSERLDDFILVRSGTGLGVGLVLGGEVFRGDAVGEGLAGEFGHMTIVAGGKTCVCGNRGCWERYASAPAAAALYMGERVQLAGQAAPRFVEVVARAEGGELRAQRTLERVGEYLGIGIGNVIMGLGVMRVIVSGRLVYGWKFMREPLHNAVAQSMAGRLHGWSVEPGEAIGAGLGGALEIAVDTYLSAVVGVASVYTSTEYSPNSAAKSQKDIETTCEISIEQTVLGGKTR